MSAAKTADAAKPGELFSGPKLLANLSPAAVTAQVVSKSNAGVTTFDVRFMGIKIAKAACKTTNGKQIWTEVK